MANSVSDIDNMSPAIHPVAEPPTFAIPTVMKYNIPKETEFNHAYEVVVALELEYKNIKFSVKPNLVGDLILSPQDHNTAKILSEASNLNGKTIKIIPLDPEEKTTRMVLLRYPLKLPVEVIIKHAKSDQGSALCYESRQSTDKASGHQGDSPRGETQGRNHHDSQVPKLWKETSRLEHIMPREERADESCNGKNSTTKHNRSTSKHIRVGSTATENSQPNTHSAPTVRGFLSCTSPTRLQDKIEDTGTKSVHVRNHDKSVDSTTAASELYNSKSTEQSCIGGEQNIAWDTATAPPPSGAHPTEYTPACQSASGIHRRTNKTDDHYYDSDCFYNNKEQDTNTENIIKAIMTQLAEKMQEDQSPKNSTSGTDDTLESDIRQEEELAIRSITQNRETSGPLQQIPRNRTTNTDRQQTYDHRQERHHPEERRKNSLDTSQNKRNYTSCSSLRAGAQERATNEHTIPNGRGGERLNYERREQLQHQRRGDNDRIAPPPGHLRITQ
ncbi:hypothetical protein Hamer_G003476 [Homarus americanus]|uniref:Uncharacterized protein n=1 Tax=Homarus americanus TaxID=6706 RepID=A0A8J5JU64_HOMAM|nr:hypothetical protein Hamer_G003476 [Homarus americanus]